MSLGVTIEISNGIYYRLHDILTTFFVGISKFEIEIINCFVRFWLIWKEYLIEKPLITWRKDNLIEKNMHLRYSV